MILLLVMRVMACVFTLPWFPKFCWQFVPKITSYFHRLPEKEVETTLSHAQQRALARSIIQDVRLDEDDDDEAFEPGQVPEGSPDPPSAEEKARAVTYAIIHSTHRAVAEYDLPARSIRRWKARVLELEAVPGAVPEGETADQVLERRTRYLEDRRPGRSGVRAPEGLDAGVMKEFRRARSDGVEICNEDLQIMARDAAVKLGAPPGQFKASLWWVQHFKERNRIVLRQPTQRSCVKKDTPEIQKSVRRLYLARLAWVASKERITKRLFFHADESPLMLVPRGKVTLEERGTGEVLIESTGDKRQVTLMVGGDMTTPLRPFVVWNQTLSGVETSGVEVARSPNHWMTPQTCVLWIQRVLAPAVEQARSDAGVADDHPAILSWDCTWHCVSTVRRLWWTSSIVATSGLSTFRQGPHLICRLQMWR